MINLIKKYKEQVYLVLIGILIITQVAHQIWNSAEFRKVVDHELVMDKKNHQMLCMRIQNLEKSAFEFYKIEKEVLPCNYLEKKYE